MRGIGFSGYIFSDSGMFIFESCRGGWVEVGGVDVLFRMMFVGRGRVGFLGEVGVGLVFFRWVVFIMFGFLFRSVRCSVGIGFSMFELMVVRFVMDFREFRGLGVWGGKRCLVLGCGVESWYSIYRF